MIFAYFYVKIIKIINFYVKNENYERLDEFLFFYQIMQHLQELQNEAKVRNPYFFTKKVGIIEIH